MHQISFISMRFETHTLYNCIKINKNFDLGNNYYYNNKNKRKMNPFFLYFTIICRHVKKKKEEKIRNEKEK